MSSEFAKKSSKPTAAEYLDATQAELIERMNINPGNLDSEFPFIKAVLDVKIADSIVSTNKRLVCHSKNLVLVTWVLCAATIASVYLTSKRNEVSSSHVLSDEGRIFHGAYRVGRFSGEPRKLPELTAQQVLDEANRSFTYRGKPIHPKLVCEFQCLDSDLNPVTFAVDVSAAFDSNEYYDAVDVSDGWVSFSDGEGRYGYRHTGFNKREGVHILESVSSGSGSYVARSTLWVKFEIGQSIYPDGKPYDQLILRLVRVF